MMLHQPLTKSRQRIAAFVALLIAAIPVAAQSVSAPLTVTTFAGAAGERQVTNGVGASARFYAPSGLAIDSSGNLIVADTANNVFRKITPAGVVTIFSGSPVDPENLPINVGSSDGAPTTARFYIGQAVSHDGTYGEPISLSIGATTLGKDSSGNIYFADTLNHRIRRLSATGDVTTIAGSGGQGSTDGAAGSAGFDTPMGVAVDAAGNVYVADSSNNTIRKISGGTVTTLAGAARTFGSADGSGSSARFLNPTGLAVDSAGNVYVADTANHTIRKITSAGLVTTLAGSAGQTGSADGSGASARFSSPTALAVDASGYVYVADSGNHAIRKVSPTGSVSTIAGAVGASGSADGTGSAARFFEPSGIVIDGSGSLFISDTMNNTIRRATVATTSDSLQVTSVPPALVQVVVNSTINLKVVATGSPAPSYQWFKDGDAVAGATSATLTLAPATSAIAGNYTVSVSSGGLTFRSSPTRVQVFAIGTPVPTVTLVSQPSDRTVAAGQSATFSVEAVSPNPITYQWNKDGVLIPGATSSTYTIASAQAADTALYTVTVSDDTSAVTSTNASLYVTGSASPTAPTIISQPSAQTVATGGTATFGVAATGTPAPAYRWNKDGVPLSDGGNISGSGTATLTLSGVSAANAGSYTVLVSNVAGSALSNPATLTIGTVTASNPMRISNISVLTPISAGESFKFGFYLGGSGTSGTKPVLLRGMGPSLIPAPFNVTDALLDPTINAYDGQTPVASNDNWGGSGTITQLLADLSIGLPFASTTSLDAALYRSAITPNSAGHSIEIGGKTGSGRVLAELYDASTTFTASTPRLVNVSLMKNVGSSTTLGFFVGGPSNSTLRVLVRAVGPGIGPESDFKIAGAMTDPQMVVNPLGSSNVIASNDNWGGTTALQNAFNQAFAFGLANTSKDSAVVLNLAPGGYTVTVSPASGSATGVALLELFVLE